MSSKRETLCDMDCFHCKFSDCINSRNSFTAWEKEQLRMAHSETAWMSEAQKKLKRSEYRYTYAVLQKARKEGNV